MGFRELVIAIVLPLRQLHAVRLKKYPLELWLWAILLKTRRMCIAKYWTAAAGRRLTCAARFMGIQKNIGTLAV